MPSRHPASALGRWSARHARIVVLVWVLLGALALWQAGKLRDVLRGELGSVPGSTSDRAMAELASAFDYPYAQPLLVTLEAAGDAVPAVADLLAARLRELPAVRAVRPLPGADPHLRALAIGLKATTLRESEAAVPAIRKLVGQTVPPGVRALTTGHAALNSDMVKLGSEQAAQAEWRVLPFVLIALAWAFGMVGAALLPLITGILAVLVALGGLAIAGQVWHLSILSANVATMVGLALGIDYALLVVSRIREEGGAVGAAAARTGPVILTSAGTVLIGFAALALVPVPETVGMGLGGVIVTLSSLLAALTLLPALAALLGNRLDAPRRFSRHLAGGARIKWWRARARFVVRHPAACLAAACLVLGLLAWPIAQFRLGFPGFGVAPGHLESVQALHAVERLGLGGALLPSHLIVRAPDGQPLLTPERLRGLNRLAAWLEDRPEVARVHALAGTGANLNSLILGAKLVGPRGLPGQLPAEGRALMSRDGEATLIVAIPSNDLDYGAVREFNRALRAQDWTRFGGLEGATVLVGGATSTELDFIALSQGAMPWLGLFVLGCTFGSLFALTRSLAIPLKAVLTNLLTVGATLGAATWLFQSPAASRLLGLPEPIMTVPALFPVMVFALLFGLSMDYETFLISRIQEAHLAGQDDAHAVLAGMGASGGIISSTAAIMAIVFAGFAACELVPVKLLGTTLAIGIVLDATVTRLLLVPAAVVLLGRWNWWPGRQSRAASKSASTS